MRFIRGCISTLIAAIILLALAVGAALWYLRRPFPARQSHTFVEIDRGLSTRAIGQKLADAGVIQSSAEFLVLRTLHPRAALQAGEYEFGAAQSPFAIFDKIRRGEIFFEEITIPEGSSKFDIAQLLGKTDTVKPDDFLRAANDPALIADLDGQAPSLEGYLFPSTYRVTHRTTARQLCAAMVNEFRKRWKALGGTDVHRTVTLASLVEKETAVPAERPLVAAVFTNRLRDSMPLQCDPTVVYAAQIANRYTGVIHKSDLANPGAYNTYAHPGLPPGPIANPGSSALTAAISPAQASYLYFVALPGHQGAHHFSTTLAEHERAVAEYRRQGG